MLDECGNVWHLERAALLLERVGARLCAGDGLPVCLWAIGAEITGRGKVSNGCNAVVLCCVVWGRG